MVSQGIVAPLFKTPSTQEAEGEAWGWISCEFETSLIYIVSFRPVIYIVLPCINKTNTSLFGGGKSL